MVAVTIGVPRSLPPRHRAFEGGPVVLLRSGARFGHAVLLTCRCHDMTFHVGIELFDRVAGSALQQFSGSEACMSACACKSARH